MVVKLYVANKTRDIDVRVRQNRAEKTLIRENIDFELVDISDPDGGEQRQFLLDRVECDDAQSMPPTPQFFNDDIYLGDYDDFNTALESETLLEFLNVDDEAEAEDETLPDPEPPRMVFVKVYVALISSSQLVKKHQTKAMMILESKGTPQLTFLVLYTQVPSTSLTPYCALPLPPLI